MPEIHVLLVGESGRPEFRDAVAELRQLAHVRISKDWETAESILADGPFVPDLIVVAQAYPGQCSAEDVDRLRGQAPLARVIALLGSWCEGEMRTGKPWPAAVRVYWHQWPARCRRELRRLAAGKGSSWCLPVTASDEEQILATAEAPPAARHQGLVVIHARQFEMQSWLSAACRRQGYGTVWLQPGRAMRVEGARAAIFDFGGAIQDELADLESLARALQPAPLIALLNFPRLDQRDRVLEGGAAAVLSKPLWLADLLEQLDRLICS